jgi:hypothetical protein
MARPRTPTTVLELSGAFKNYPSRGRDRKDEPRIATALPEPPGYLDSGSAAMWLQMKSRGYWLTSADQFLVEIAATLMARYRIDELRSGDVSLLIGLLGKIGFSPSERGKMNLPMPETLAFQSEANLERNLVMADLAILDVSPRLNNFEPVHIPDSLARVCNRCADRFLDTGF